MGNKKFDYGKMERAIRENWSAFQERMHEEWREFQENELEEAKENLHSFVVQVERRTHEPANYVKGKLASWQREISGGRRNPP